MTTPHTLEDPLAATARLSVDKVANQLDNYNEIVDSAHRANQAEHDLTLWQALKRNRKAVLWSMFISSALVMEGYDLATVNSFFGQKQFQRHYGQFDEKTGKWFISAPWQSGLSNATLCGQMIGLAINGVVSQKIGYRKTMIGALIVMTITIFGVFFAPTLPLFCLAEIFCGLPWGVFQTLTTAYAADICPINLRPLLTSYINMCWGFGILISSGVLRGSTQLEGTIAYKLPFALQWIWPVPLIIGVFLSPESPWWLVRNGKLQQAAHSLRRLSHDATTDKEIEEQVAMMQHTDAIEKAETKGATYLDCFRKTNRRRTEIGCVIFALQQTSGGPLVGYAVTFMQAAGMGEDAAFSMNIGVTSMYAIGTVISWFYMTRLGRRTIYTYGLLAMMVVCMIIGVLGCFPGTEMAVGGMLIILNLAYNTSIGPVCYSIVGEMSSARLRPVSIVLARMAYNFTGLISNAITPRMIQATAWNWGAKAGFFWAVSAFLSAAYCYFRLPETKDRTYGELDVLFEQKVSARKFSSTKVDMFLHTDGPHNHNSKGSFTPPVAEMVGEKRPTNHSTSTVDDKKDKTMVK